MAVIQHNMIIKLLAFHFFEFPDSRSSIHDKTQDYDPHLTLSCDSADLPYAMRCIETLVIEGVPPDNSTVREFQALSTRLMRGNQKDQVSTRHKMVAIEAVLSSMADGMRMGTTGAIDRLGGMSLPERGTKID